MGRLSRSVQRKAGEVAEGDVSSPSSVADILYLISSYRSAVLRPESLRTLDGARLHFIRGEIGAALVQVDRALEGMDDDGPVYRDVIAFRLFVSAMSGRQAERWVAGPPGEESANRPDPLKVVTLCVESDEQWHSGSLMQGLRLGRLAVEHSGDVTPIWQVYARLLLAKKLSDIHVHLQAERVIHDLDTLIESTGLLVVSSLPEALRAVLHLQAGRFEQAVRSAASAVRDSEETTSAVGVRLALSTAATAHLGRGEYDRAAELLVIYHEKIGYYALPDSIARSAFAEIALTVAREGPQAGAEQIRAKWHLLSTESGCFLEDPSRPAWLIAVARGAGDTELAERCLRAIVRLAENNRGLSLLAMAADSARAAWEGGRPELWSVTDFGVGPSTGVASPYLPALSPASFGTSLPPPRHLPPDTGPAGRPQPGHPEDPDGTGGPGDTGDTGHAGGTGGTDGARDAGGTGGADSGEPDANARPAGDPAELSSLSDREREVARLAGRGMTNQQVAKRLGLSPHTVNFHLRNVFRKLSISTRVKLGPLMARFDQRPDA